jgi:hypothetical protein
VPAQLLNELLDARTRNEPFSDAWPRAVAVAVRGASKFERTLWATALHSTADAWRRAYVGEAPAKPECAVVVVRERAEAMLIDEPADLPTRGHLVA